MTRRQHWPQLEDKKTTLTSVRGQEDNTDLGLGFGELPCTADDVAEAAVDVVVSQLVRKTGQVLIELVQGFVGVGQKWQTEGYVTPLTCRSININMHVRLSVKRDMVKLNLKS